MSKGVQIALGAGVIALLLGWYAVSNLDALGSYTYYQTLSEFQAEGELGTQVRVHGFVAAGSIVRDLHGRQVQFAVQNEPPHATVLSGERMPVIFASLETPDLFKDGAEVVVEGRLESTANGPVFLADNVLAKCPSKFEAERVEAAAF